MLDKYRYVETDLYPVETDLYPLDSVSPERWLIHLGTSSSASGTAWSSAAAWAVLAGSSHSLNLN